MPAPLRLAAVLAIVCMLPGCGAIHSEPPVHAAQPEGLADATPLPVTSRPIETPGTPVRFGDYATIERHDGPLDARAGGAPRVWRIDQYEKRFEHFWSNATRRVSFLQQGPDGDAQVRLVGRSTDHRDASVDRWIGRLSLEAGHDSSQVTLLGTIEPVQPDRPAWRFGLWQDIQDGRLQTGGWAEDDQGHGIAISPIHEFDRELRLPKWLPPPQLTGLRFDLDGRAAASLDLVGRGTVRLQDDLPADQRLVMAALCSAALIQQALVMRPDNRAAGEDAH